MRVMLSCGDISGDKYGAQLAMELKALDPGGELFGMGSSSMAKEGVDIVFDVTSMSTVGIVESLQHMYKLKKVLGRMIQIMDFRRPDVVVLIDFPVFNMRLAKAAKSRQIPVVYYFSPTVWAWNGKRAEVIAKSGARVCAVLPIEFNTYQQFGARVDYVGHPLLDMIKPISDTSKIREALGFTPADRVVALLPGSRKEEVQRLLPPMLSAIKVLQARNPRVRAVLLLASNLSTIDTKMEGVVVTRGEAAEICTLAELALIACGTATLEAALIGIPQIALYKLSPLTFQILKRLVKIPDVALPNIIAGERVVPELIQHEVTPEKIAALAEAYLENSSKVTNIKEAYKRIVKRLSPSEGEYRGAATRVAKIILEEGEENPCSGR